MSASFTRRLLSSTGLNLLDQVVKIGSVLILSPLVIQALGKEANGVWRFIFVWFGWLQLIDAGLSLSSTRFASRALGEKDEERWWDVLGTAHRYFRRIAGVAFGLIFLLALSFWVWMPSGPTWSSEMISLIALMAGVPVAYRLWTKAYNIALRSRLRYDLLTIPSITRTVLQLVVLWVIVRNGWGNLWTISITMTACELAEALASVWLTRRALKISWPALNQAVRRPGVALMARDLSQHARASFLTVVGAKLRSQVDPLVVKGLAGFGMVTVYTTGSSLVTIFEDIVNAVLGGPVLSALSQLDGSGEDARLDRLFLQVTRIAVIVSFIIGGGLMIFCQAFITRWMGSGFEIAIAALWILVPGYTLRLMQYGAYTLFFSVGKPHYVSGLTLWGGGFNLVVSLLLAWWIGVLGVAWGTTIELVLGAVFVIPWLVARCTGTSVATYAGLLIRASLLMLIPIVAYGWGIQRWLRPEYPTIILATLGYLALMTFWLWAVMATGPERRQVWQMARTRIFRK
jgi:O-antigen/teichoic acid export membrane protein